MALIIKCKNCRRRVAADKNKCPACGGAEFGFFVDYWPEGRNGPRKIKKLDASIADKNAAIIFEQELMAALKESRHPENTLIKTNTATCDDLFPGYLEWVRLHLKKSTYEEREYTMQTISKIIGNVPVRAINKHYFSLYQQTRKAQGVSNRTINKELDYVRGFLRWCREEKGINAPPFDFKKLKHARPIPMVLSPAEVVRIIDAAGPFHRAFFLCLYTLGLRLSEARYLTWGDIDFGNKTVQTIQKGGTYKILPLNNWLKKALGKLKRGQANDYIFLNPLTGKPVRDIRAALNTAAKKAGVIKHVYPHLFRHSVATHMMGENVNLRKIQMYLGHSVISTTEWYTHVVTDHLKEATGSMFKRLSTTKANKKKVLYKRVSTPS
jgi:site-specific recombinase XerD